MKIRYFFPLFLISLVSSIQGEQQHKVISLKQFRYAQLLMKHRKCSNLINYLVVTRNYQNYLEIGMGDGTTLRSITATHKVGVDPFPQGLCDFQMTSDKFFELNQENFDIIFIDGMHLYEQVLRDVINSLKCLNPGGMIVVHDCLPQCSEHQHRIPILNEWNGDVWKAAAYIRMYFQNVHFCVLDMDWGCGLVTPNTTQDLYPQISFEQLDWDYYIENRGPLLNIVKVEDWVQTFR